MNKSLKLAMFFAALSIPAFNTQAQDDIYYSPEDDPEVEAVVEEEPVQQVSRHANDTDTLIVYDDSDYVYSRRLNRFHDADLPVYSSEEQDDNGDINVTNIYVTGGSPYYTYYRPGLYWNYGYNGWGYYDPWYDGYYYRRSHYWGSGWGYYGYYGYPYYHRHHGGCYRPAGHYHGNYKPMPQTHRNARLGTRNPRGAANHNYSSATKSTNPGNNTRSYRRNTVDNSRSYQNSSRSTRSTSAAPAGSNSRSYRSISSNSNRSYSSSNSPSSNSGSRGSSSYSGNSRNSSSYSSGSNSTRSSSSSSSYSGGSRSHSSGGSSYSGGSRGASSHSSGGSHSGGSRGGRR